MGLEPWGEERADLRSGTIAATVANFLSGKRRTPYQPKDFMPKPLEERMKESAEAKANRLKGIVEQWNAVLGGHDKRTKEP